jgi:lipooligosaccharide transport system permease protein
VRVRASSVGHFLEREALVYRRLWHGTVFSAFVGPALFLVAMGKGLGSYVGTNASLGGVDYLDFVAPGILCASVMQMAGADGLWPVMGRIQWDKQYVGVVTSPITPAELAVGYLTWESLRALLVAVAFLLVASVVGGLASPFAVLAAPVCMLLAVVMSGPLAAWSSSRTSDRSFAIIFRLGIIPLFLFSGTFFPISQLPGWAQPLAQLSPLYHAVELARAATTGHAQSAAAVVGHLLVLSTVAFGGLIAAQRTFTNRLSS